MNECSGATQGSRCDLRRAHHMPADRGRVFEDPLVAVPVRSARCDAAKASSTRPFL